MPRAPLQPDPETGFLTSTARHALSSDDKVSILAQCQTYVEREEYPDLNYIMRKMGFNVQTFWRHYENDEAFKQAYDGIDLQIENILNRNLISNAKRANGVGAAAFWLKNRISKRWSDNPGGNNITVNLGDIKKVFGVQNEFIDADCTPIQPEPPQLDGK